MAPERWTSYIGLMSNDATTNRRRMPEDLDAWNERIKTVIGGALPMTFLEVSKDRVVITMEVTSATHQPMGILHGGASVVLAESAASVGAGQNCPPGKVAVGQEINANHIRPKTSGVVTATALPIHIGRTTQVWSVEIRDEAGKLVCVSRCTLAVIPTPAGMVTPRERGLRSA